MPKAKRPTTSRADDPKASSDAGADFSKLTRVIGRGIYAAEMRGAAPLKATYAVVDDSRLEVSLEDGRRVAVPLGWYPRLLHASPAERNDWRLVMGGRAVMWEPLGLCISVKAVLEGIRAEESSASLKKWLHGRGEKPKRKAV